MKEGWEVKKLGDCFSYIKNGANIKQEKNTSGYPITRIETLSNGVFNRDRMGYANVFDVEKYNSNILQDQDILMSHINSKAYIGRSVIYQKNGNEIIIHGMNLLRLIAIKEILNPYYANYYFKTGTFKGDVAKIRKDAVNQSSMAISDLSKILIPIPPLPEQSRIVEELDLLNNIIEKKRQQLSELDNLAQSIFYDMFGDPVTNEKGWEVKKLGDIAVSQIGLTYKPENVSTEGTIVLRSSNIQDSNLDFSDIVRVNCNIKDKQYVQEGDVLMCSRNGSFRLVGKVAMIKNLKEKMSYGAFMTIIRSQYQDFLFSFFKSPAFRAQLTTAKTATINQITVKMLDEIRIPLPPLSLQQLFAQKIEAIEKEKELIKQSIKATEELFNSRMDYYFI